MLSVCLGHYGLAASDLGIGKAILQIDLVVACFLDPILVIGLSSQFSPLLF